MMVARILLLWGCTPDVIRQGLHHDDTESFVGEVPFAVKRLVHGISAIETRIWGGFLASALGLPKEFDMAVKSADTTALALEAEVLWGVDIRQEWGRDYRPVTQAQGAFLRQAWAKEVTACAEDRKAVARQIVNWSRELQELGEGK